MSEITIKVENRVTGSERESAWVAYEAAFAPLRIRAMQRACMTRAEFDACMADSRIAKYLAVDGEGRVQGMGTMTNQIEAVTLVSPEFFAHRWPEYYSTGRCYYIGVIGAAPGHQGSQLFTRLAQLMSYTAWLGAGVCVIDVCQRNVEEFALPQSLARIGGQVVEGLEAELVDTQTYWAYTTSIPVQRRTERVIDLRELSERAAVELAVR